MEFPFKVLEDCIFHHSGCLLPGYQDLIQWFWWELGSLVWHKVKWSISQRVELEHQAKAWGHRK